MPHEQLALLALLGFVVAINFPRFTRRHGFCSLDALRGGRLWTLVTSNFADGEPAHLLHNLLHLLHLGPVMHGALGCNKAAQLLLAIAIASSFASIFWNGVLGGRSHTPAVGGSGLVMGLVAANAALIERRGGSVASVALDWIAPDPRVLGRGYDAVVGADLCFAANAEGAAALAQPKATAKPVVPAAAAHSLATGQPSSSHYGHASSSSAQQHRRTGSGGGGAAGGGLGGMNSSMFKGMNASMFKMGGVGMSSSVSGMMDRAKDFSAKAASGMKEAADKAKEAASRAR